MERLHSKCREPLMMRWNPGQTNGNGERWPWKGKLHNRPNEDHEQRKAKSWFVLRKRFLMPLWDVNKTFISCSWRNYLRHSHFWDWVQFQRFSDDTVHAYLTLKEKAPNTDETLVSAYHNPEGYNLNLHHHEK